MRKNKNLFIGSKSINITEGNTFDASTPTIVPCF
jgi:hypothetical protein